MFRYVHMLSIDNGRIIFLLSIYLYLYLVHVFIHVSSFQNSCGLTNFFFLFFFRFLFCVYIRRESYFRISLRYCGILLVLWRHFCRYALSDLHYRYVFLITWLSFLLYSFAYFMYYYINGVC